MKKTILRLVLLLSIVLYAQEKEENETFLFENKLTLKSNIDSIKEHIKIIKEISVASSIDSIQVNSK